MRRLFGWLPFVRRPVPTRHVGTAPVRYPPRLTFVVLPAGRHAREEGQDPITALVIAKRVGRYKLIRRRFVSDDPTRPVGRAEVNRIVADARQRADRVDAVRARIIANRGPARPVRRW